MGALLKEFAAAGVRLEVAEGGKLRAHGMLTDELRHAIRASKPAILAELAAANDAPARRWRVQAPAGASMQVLLYPAATRDDVASLYPGATLEPLPDDEAANAPALDAEVARRRERVLAMLEEEPARTVAFVADAGDPPHVAVAVRGVAVGELKMRADRYEQFALGGFAKPQRGDTPQGA